MKKMMKKNKKNINNRPRLALAVLMLGLSLAGFAGPARRGIVHRLQPDGSTVQLRLTGDEFSHTYTTLDGTPVVEDENGFFRLRTEQEGREMKAARARRIQATRGGGIPDYRMSAFNARGNVHGVVLLVAYADVAFSADSATIHDTFANRFNGDNYTENFQYSFYSNAAQMQIDLSGTIPGSARDYFRDQSLGKFTPTFDVFGPITLDQNRAYYGGNDRGGSDVNAKGMVKDACLKAYESGLTDFSAYDNDGDGYVDYVYVVYAGSDEAQFGSPDCIWAHSWNLSSPLVLGNQKIYKYACSGELYMDSSDAIQGIGTFVHEFSHVIGLPDFYNTQIDSPAENDFCMDYWSIMDYGQYCKNGYCPAGYTSFERYSMGWIPAHELNSPDSIIMQVTGDDPVMYRTFVNDNDTTAYYIFENIQRNGWGQGLPNYGLMITCVNYKASAWTGNNVNANKSRHRYHIVPANNEYSYENENEQLYGRTNYEFTPESLPASITCFGDTLFKPLTQITRTKNGPCTFNFMGGDNRIELQRNDFGEKRLYRINDNIVIVQDDDKTYKILSREKSSGELGF